MTNALIEKLSRRDQLSAVEIAALKDVLDPPRAIAANVDIMREHAHASHSLLIVSGLTARYSTLSDGRRQITEINVTGDFVDLHSLLMKQMDHGVMTLTPCEISSAPHSRLRELTEKHPHLARMLWLETVVDAAIHRQWLVAMGRRSGLGHLAHLLCELYVRLKAVGQTEGAGFDLPLTQSMLGDALGLSTVHVNRLIAELRREGLVRWNQSRVEIINWPRLAAIAEFDPTYLRLQNEPV